MSTVCHKYLSVFMEPLKFSKQFFHPRFLLTWLGLGVMWLLCQLPYTWIQFIGKGLGKVAYYLGKQRRHIAETNIKLCFPELSSDEQAALVKRSFHSLGISMLETGMAWWWPKSRLAKYVVFEGKEHLEALKDQGVLLVAMHFTTLEIGAALLGMHFPIDGMYRKHKNPVFDYIQRRGRENYHPSSRTIPRKDIRTMLKALRDGRIVWYAPDQDYGPKQSVFVPFFGVQAATVTATSKFARMGKAKVVVFSQQRLPGNKGYLVTIHPPLSDFPSKDEAADALRVNQCIEQEIRKKPDQYMWLHRRFKTRPEGEAKLY